jgi:hypothetical protein
MDLKTEYKDMKCTLLVQDRRQRRLLVKAVTNICVS